jgi:hypothetical protein
LLYQLSYGPTCSRLAARGAAGKALGKMADGERAAHAPAGGDRGEGLEDEAAPFELGVRDGEPARAPLAPAPQDEIEVEHAWRPAAAAAAAEIALDRLERVEQLRRVEIAFDQRNRIGEVAPGATMRRVEDDRRGVEQAEVLVEPRDRGLDHLRRAAVAAVRAVRPDGDGVEMGHGVGVTQSVTLGKAGVPLFFR